MRQLVLFVLLLGVIKHSHCRPAEPCVAGEPEVVEVVYEDVLGPDTNTLVYYPVPDPMYYRVEDKPAELYVNKGYEINVKEGAPVYAPAKDTLVDPVDYATLDFARRDVYYQNTQPPRPAAACVDGFYNTDYFKVYQIGDYVPNSAYTPAPMCYETLGFDRPDVYQLHPIPTETWSFQEQYQYKMCPWEYTTSTLPVECDSPPIKVEECNEAKPPIVQDCIVAVI